MLNPNAYPIYRLPRPPKEKLPNNDLLAVQDTGFPDIYFPNFLRDIKELRVAWLKVRSTRDRYAIYLFLEPVFELVTKCQRTGRCQRLLRKIAKISISPFKTKNLFAAVIHCVVPIGSINSRTRGKWSRALNYALEHKKASESLQSFMLRNSGINECAARCRQRG